MKSLDKQDSEIVRDALHLLKGFVTKQHLSKVSKLPGNGKSAADASSEAAEKSTINQLKDIDKVLRRFRSNSKGSTDVSLGQDGRNGGAAKTATLAPDVTTNDDNEPYINPFTGQMVYPANPYTPGPSGTHRNVFTQRQSLLNEYIPAGQYEQENEAEDDAEYRKAIQVAAVSNPPEIDDIDEDLEYEYGLSLKQTVIAQNLTAPSPTPSAIDDPYTDDGLQNSNSGNLQSIFSDFDNFFSGSNTAFHPYPTPPDDVTRATHSLLTKDPPKHIHAQTVQPAPTPEAPYMTSSLAMHSLVKKDATKEAAPMSPHSSGDWGMFEAPDADPMYTDTTKGAHGPHYPQSIRSSLKKETSEHGSGLGQKAGELYGSVVSTFRWRRKTDSVPAELDVQSSERDVEDIPDEYLHAAAGLQASRSINRSQLGVPQQDQKETLLSHLRSEDVDAEEREAQTLLNIQHEIQHEEKEELATLRKIEEEWNASWDESHQAQHTLAEQVADQALQMERIAELREMRRLQAIFQAEDVRQLEADRALAWSLSEEGSRGQPLPNADYLYPFELPNDAPPAYSESGKVGSILPWRKKKTSREKADRELDNNSEDNAFGGTTDIFKQAQYQRKHWQAEIDRNAQKVKSARQEIEQLEAQARRDYELARQQQLQHQAEVERSRREAEDRRRQEDRQRRQREERARLEAERIRKAEEAARKARMATCNVCDEEFEKTAMYVFKCKHAYCTICLEQSIRNALKSKSIFKCCKDPVDLSSSPSLLAPQLTQEYLALAEERNTRKPLYCAKRSCAKFIPVNNIHGGIGLCGTCSQKTCASCRNASHTGVCKQDKDGQALLKLGKAQHWKQCPNCENMVDRNGGCLQMSCRCGVKFCYSCGKTSDLCSGTCPRPW